MTVPKEKIIIGREGEQSFSITDQTVSRSHLVMTRELYEGAMRYFIETVNPRQVLRIDGTLMEKAVLTPESIVEIGPNFYKLDVLKLFDDFIRIYGVFGDFTSPNTPTPQYSVPIDLPKQSLQAKRENLKKTFSKEEIDVSHLRKLKTQMKYVESEYERNCKMIGIVEKCCYVVCILLLGITFREGEYLLLSLISRILVFAAFVGLLFVMKLRLTRKFRFEYEEKLKVLRLNFVCPKCKTRLQQGILPEYCPECSVIYK